MVPYLCWHWGENAGILGLCMRVLVCMSKKPPEVLSLWQLQFLATRCKTAILLSPPRPLSLGLAKPKLKGLYTSSKNPLPTQTSAPLNHCYSCCCLQEKQHVSVHFQLVLTRKTNNCCETTRASLRSKPKQKHQDMDFVLGDPQICLLELPFIVREWTIAAKQDYSSLKILYLLNEQWMMIVTQQLKSIVTTYKTTNY